MTLTEIYRRFITVIFPCCDMCNKRKFVEFTTKLKIRGDCKFCECTSYSLCIKCYNFIYNDVDEQMNYYLYHENELLQKHITEEHSSVELTQWIG